jgi:hypothetical protein
MVYTLVSFACTPVARPSTPLAYLISVEPKKRKKRKKKRKMRKKRGRGSKIPDNDSLPHRRLSMLLKKPPIISNSIIVTGLFSLKSYFICFKIELADCRSPSPRCYYYKRLRDGSVSGPGAPPPPR